MLECLWFIIYGIFTASAEDKHKTVNLALETVLEFNKKDNTGDIKFLDNVHNFIDKLKHVINKNSIRRRDFNSKRLETFTDFIQILIEVISKYKDKDLEYLCAIISEEMRKYHYKGSKFHELTDNYSLRRFIASKLDEFKGLPSVTIKKRLAAVSKKLKQENYHKHERDLIDFINSLYSKDSIDKLNNVLIDLDDYRLKPRKDVDLADLVIKGLRSVIFDYYSNLNLNARRALKAKLDDFWKYMTDIKIIHQRNESEQPKIPIHLATSTDRTISKQYKSVSQTAATSNTHMVVHQNHALRTIPSSDESKDDLGSDESIPQSDFDTTTRKKMSFMTLYPAFVAGWSASEESEGKKVTRKKHKRRKTKRTTEEIRTLRQMYVEKHLDLKYDPYAYDHLTTQYKNKVKRGKKRTTTETTTTKHLRRHTKSKRLNVVTKRPYTAGKIRQFEKFDKFDVDSNKPLTGSQETAKHLKKYEVHFKKSNLRRPKHYRKPIVPLKNPNKDIGHPIGMLMNDLTTITEKFLNLNHKLTNSDPAFYEKKLITTVQTLPTNKFIRPAEELESRQDLRQETFNVPKTKPPRVPSVNPYEVIIKQHLPSAEEKIEYLNENDKKIIDTHRQVQIKREEIVGYDDNLLYEDLNDKPYITTNSVVINKMSSVPTDNINKNTRSSKERAAIFADSLSEGEINDLGDASMNQLKILAADVNTVNKFSTMSTKEINPFGSNRRSINYHRTLDENILNRLKRLEKELKVVKTQVNDDNKIIKDLKTIVQKKDLRRAKQASKTKYFVTKAIRERPKNIYNNKIKILDSPIETMFDSNKKPDLVQNNFNKHVSRAKINNKESVHQYKTASKLKQNDIDRKFDLDVADNVHEAVNDTLTDSNEKMYIDNPNDSIEEYQKINNLEPNKSYHKDREPLNFDKTTRHTYNSENKRKRFMIARRDTIETIQYPTTKNYRLRDYHSDKSIKKQTEIYLTHKKPQLYINTVYFDQDNTEKDKFGTNIYQNENKKDTIESDNKFTLVPVKIESEDNNIRRLVTIGSDRDKLYNSNENKFPDEGMKSEYNNYGNHEKLTYGSDLLKQGKETNDDRELNSNKIKNNHVNVDNIISSVTVRDETDIERSTSLFNIYEYPDQKHLTTTTFPLTSSYQYKSKNDFKIDKVRNNKHIKQYHDSDNSIQVSNKGGGSFLKSIESGTAIAETQKASNEKVKENRNVLDLSDTKKTQFRYSNDIHDRYMNTSHSERRDTNKKVGNYLDSNQLKIGKDFKASESPIRYAKKLLPVLQSYNDQINKANTAREIKSSYNKVQSIQNVPHKDMSSIDFLNITINHENVNHMNTNNYKRYINENTVSNVSDYNLRGAKVGNTLINHLNKVDKIIYNYNSDVVLNVTSNFHSPVRNRDSEGNNNEARKIFEMRPEFHSNAEYDNNEFNNRQEKYNLDLSSEKRNKSLSADVNKYKQNIETQKGQQPEQFNKNINKKYFSNPNLHPNDDKNITKFTQDHSTHSSQINLANLDMNNQIKRVSGINPIKTDYTSSDSQKNTTRIVVNKDLMMNVLKQSTTSLDKFAIKENFNSQNRTNTTKENLEVETM